MNYELIIRPDAEAELTEAFRWYEQQVPGLGNQFLLSVDAALYSIQRSPQMYPMIYGSVRRVLTRRFPYQIFYVLEEFRIVVIAVFHGMRNPKSWQDRLE